MTPRIDFYVSQDSGADVRLRLACRVAEKAYLAQQKVVVLLEDAETLKRFDDLLWTFADGSFVPHDRVDAGGGPCEAPVALSTGALPAAHHDVLMNLSGAVPQFFEQFGRVAEFLDARPDVRAAGRERFKVYRAKSLEPQTHNV
ncbi:MAG TPA: DNA polymerase III subunit chi [Steroidobacteraceae bacterium]|nr:DNA polymerase III subunit chi [Steroidobacteraceae bacterium]